MLTTSTEQSCSNTQSVHQFGPFFLMAAFLCKSLAIVGSRLAPSFQARTAQELAGLSSEARFRFMALWEAEGMGAGSKIHTVDESARFLKLHWGIDSLEETESRELTTQSHMLLVRSLTSAHFFHRRT